MTEEINKMTGKKVKRDPETELNYWNAKVESIKLALRHAEQMVTHWADIKYKEATKQ